MERTCDTCGKDISDMRADARYCSGTCRMAAMRAKREAAKPKPRRLPLPEQFFRRTFSLTKCVESLDRLTGDDRFPRHRGELAASYRNDLVRALESLAHVLAGLKDGTRAPRGDEAVLQDYVDRNDPTLKAAIVTALMTDRMAKISAELASSGVEFESIAPKDASAAIADLDDAVVDLLAQTFAVRQRLLVAASTRKRHTVVQR